MSEQFTKAMARFDKQQALENRAWSESNNVEHLSRVATRLEMQSHHLSKEVFNEFHQSNLRILQKNNKDHIKAYTWSKAFILSSTLSVANAVTSLVAASFGFKSISVGSATDVGKEWLNFSQYMQSASQAFTSAQKIPDQLHQSTLKEYDQISQMLQDLKQRLDQLKTQDSQKVDEVKRQIDELLNKIHQAKSGLVNR